MPPLFENQVIQVTGESTVPQSHVCDLDPIELSASVDLCFSSINVLSLDDKKANFPGSRIVRLDHQLH